MTRQATLRAWLAYYKARGTTRSLALIEENLRVLKRKVMIMQHKRTKYAVRLYFTMCYGVHQRCRTLIIRAEGI